MNTLSSAAPPDIETTIIGAGVIGLAIARSLARAGHDVMVVEQHPIIGMETSSRNSEVIHAGIYYPKDSLKARSCVTGKQQLYEFCNSHNVPYKRIGKLIVANDEDQKAMLDKIAHHAEQNNVTDLRFLNRAELHQIEPALNGATALLSPSTGIIDTHTYMLALQGDAENNGCQMAFNTKVSNWRSFEGDGFEVTSKDDVSFTTKNLIVSGGLHTSNFLNSARNELESAPPPTYYAKGNYFRLARKAPFSHLIYPVPEPGGLGVHLTLDMAGQARFGPDVEWTDEINYLVDKDRGEKFYAAIRSYWPELPDGSLEPDYAGIRPKLSRPGETNADFKIWGPADHGLPGLIALLGIESPGLTASLALADHVERLFQ